MEVQHWLMGHRLLGYTASLVGMVQAPKQPMMLLGPAISVLPTNLVALPGVYRATILGCSEDTVSAMDTPASVSSPNACRLRGLPQFTPANPKSNKISVNLTTKISHALHHVIADLEQNCKVSLHCLGPSTISLVPDTMPRPLHHQLGARYHV